MKITWTITADCDPPPDADVFEREREQLESDLEDAVAGILLLIGAGFSIEATQTVEI